jgi:putative SOS response-associated peptidase YedK
MEELAWIAMRCLDAVAMRRANRLDCVRLIQEARTMCGRFTLRLTPGELQQVFDLFREPETVPRYNIAPTQSVPVIRRTGEGNELSMMRWGLIPSWAKDVKIGASLINARSETAATKPAFRSAFKRRRCLIPADGFYEWKPQPGQKTKQPYLIGLKSGEPFAFAGLWEIWKSPEGNSIESCTILTTEANSLLREMHDRMPVILNRKDHEVWIDSEIPSESLTSLLTPYPTETMQAAAVSTLVNNARNEKPECATPLS